MREFKVNAYITLKLESFGFNKSRTNIYVNGVLFNQCKFLLIRNLSLIEMTDFIGLYDSIDEAENSLNSSMEYQLSEINVDSETEFWGHCSNIQGWYENDYDTRLLHSNLAFPLLKKLAEVGDLLAKRVFKEEIVRRLESGFPPVVEYLIQEGYTKTLSSDELLHSVLSDTEAEVLLEIESQFSVENKKKFWIVIELEQEIAPCFTVKNKHVTGMDLFECGLESLPDSIVKLEFLEKLNIRFNKLNKLPNFLATMPRLKELHVGGNNLTVPQTLRHLTI